MDIPGVAQTIALDVYRKGYHPNLGNTALPLEHESKGESACIGTKYPIAEILEKNKDLT